MNEALTFSVVHYAPIDGVGARCGRSGALTTLRGDVTCNRCRRLMGRDDSRELSLPFYESVVRAIVEASAEPTTVHYEPAPGRVLCMMNEPLVTTNKHEVTCKRCLAKLRHGVRKRDVKPGMRKMFVRHLRKGKDTGKHDHVDESVDRKRLWSVHDKYDPNVVSDDDLYRAAYREFVGVGPDLGVDDPSDGEFLTYLLDTLAGNVPEDATDRLVARLIVPYRRLR